MPADDRLSAVYMYEGAMDEHWSHKGCVDTDLDDNRNDFNNLKVTILYVQVTQLIIN